MAGSGEGLPSPVGLRRAPGAAAVAGAAGLVLFLDLTTKILGRLLLPDPGLLLLPPVALRVVDNARGPFGFGPLRLTIVVSVMVLVLLVRNSPLSTLHSPLHQAALGLAVGGGLANLGERLLFGRTTDLLLVGQRTALNLADLAILVGLLTLLWSPRPRGPSRPAGG